MSSQHPTGTRLTSTPHLDGYLKGIRDEFDRLNHELDETRKQRDEYMIKYRSQVEELRELRQTIPHREEHQPGQGGITHANCRDTADDNSLISPISSSSEYHSSFEEEEDATTDQLQKPENLKEIGHFEAERVQEDGNECDNEITVEPTVTEIVSLSPESNSTSTNKPYSEWDVEFNSTTAALKLDLVHKLTRKGRNYVAFSMDGKYLATASNLGIVSIFDSKAGKRISVMKDLYRKEEPLSPYSCLGFSPDSKLLATGEEDGNVRIWIISQRRVRNTFRHKHEVSALNFSPNGRCIVTCSFDRTVIIWRLRDGSSSVLTTFEVFPWSVRCSLDGQYIASGCNPQKILIWDMRTGKLVMRWSEHFSDLVASLVFTPDGKGLLSASWDNRVTHWDVASFRSLGMAGPPKEVSCLVGHTSNVMTVSISPDGKWIASGSWDRTVRIWNAHEATLHCILHCPEKVSSVDFSLVGNYLAIGGDFDDVTIWNYVNL